MSIKQKNKSMKSSIIPLFLILFFTSCITTTHLHYSDPNYLSSNEFSTYEEITVNNQAKQESFSSDSTTNSETNYSVDDYYDYSFSSRIRRFHRPIFYSGYYDGIYTDYYWYNNDPFFCGTSIYFGYNWHSPYYSYYSYSPYYYNYYSPYYYGNYYGYNGYGYYQYHGLHNISYTNRSNNAYITGHRGDLSSNGGIRVLNSNANSNILSNTTKHTSTLNIRGNNTVKKNIINSRNYKNNSRIKTHNRSNNNDITDRINPRTNNSYSTPKRNTRNYNSENRSRSNSRNNSTRGVRKNVNPR